MTGNGFNITPEWRLKQIREAQRDARAGNPRRVPADETREHVERYIRFGGYVLDLSNESGVSQMAIYRIREGQRTVHRENAAALLAVELPVTTIGLTRRLQALAVAGFTSTVVEAEIGCGKTTVQALRQGDRNRRNRSKWAPEIVRAYRALDGKNPADFGIARDVTRRQRMRFLRMGWAPAGCWDTDTIDVPSAIPEWTGACGTQLGYTRHRESKVDVWVLDAGKEPVRRTACRPCLDAICLIQSEIRWENSALERAGYNRRPGAPTLEERQLREKIIKEARSERDNPRRDAAVAHARNEDPEGPGVGALGED